MRNVRDGGKGTGLDDEECEIRPPERCFFFGCRSSVLHDLCFERTGTVSSKRDVTCEVLGSGVLGTEAGGGPGSETGLRGAGTVAGLTSCSCGRAMERGRRLGSGLRIMWVGRPPWDATVGTDDEDGKGANVWRLRWGRPSQLPVQRRGGIPQCNSSA